MLGDSIARRLRVIGRTAISRSWLLSIQYVIINTRAAILFNCLDVLSKRDNAVARPMDPLDQLDLQLIDRFAIANSLWGKRVGRLRKGSIADPLPRVTPLLINILALAELHTRTISLLDLAYYERQVGTGILMSPRSSSIT